MNKVNKTSILLALTAALMIGGCASTGALPGKGAIPEELRSGFLDNYDRLQPVTNELAVYRWVNPNVDLSRYTSFMIEPVDSMVPPAYRQSLQPDPEVMAAATAYFRDALAAQLGTQFKIVDRPGKYVGRISIAITGIQPTTKQLSAWQFLPIPLIVASIGDATGTREQDVVAFMEGTITDSLNGEVLMDVMKGRVSAGEGVKRIEHITPETVKPVLDFWAEQYLRLLKDLQKKS